MIVVAPNETIAVTQNSAGNIITPALTVNGVTVPTASLAIVAAPPNGTATVNGATLLYTPNAGFTGSGSFTYTGTANVNAVASTAITAGGTGYTSAPAVAFSAPPAGGTLATGTATFAAGAVTGITLTNPGAGYLSPPAITFTGGAGTGAAATAALTPITSAAATVYANTTMEYDCACDDAFPTATLAALRQRMVVRLGYAALLVAPPGLVLLLNDFLIQAQTLLYYKYSCFRTRRWFTWAMPQGQRFYDFGANSDLCRKVLDPRKVEWVGISKGDVNWRELVCGINPVNYRAMQQAIPQFYDIRQCIEIWPAPSSNDWQLRIKGDFGLLPFAADTDVTTIDSEAVFLLALANAKAHYEQPDASSTMAMATGLIADYTAGSHFTRRYVPGVETLPNAVPPLMK